MNNKKKDVKTSLRNAKLWLPPESAMDRMVNLINLQMETAGLPMATLPDFLKYDCLRKTSSGEVEYYFGPSGFENIEHLKGKMKRQQKETPQKGQRKKKMVTSTPSKSK